MWSMENDDAYPYTSLCRVIEAEWNKPDLKILADVDGDKIVVPSTAPYKKIFTRNCRVPKDFIGIWGWRTESNRNPNGRDYIATEFFSDKVPLEVIVLDDCKNEDDFKRKLLGGLNVTLSSGKALIAYAVDRENYCGVLCTKGDFDPNGKIKSVTLKLFEFDERNVIRVDEKIFYTRLTLGAPTKTIYLRDFSKLIAEGIVSRAKKLTSIGRKDRRVIREVLSTFRPADFYADIAKGCSCSVDEVRSQVDAFIKDAQNFLTPDTFNDELLADVIQNCPAILNRCQTVVEERWSIDNAEKFSEANEQLDRIKNEIAARIERRAGLANDIERLQTKFDERRATLEQKMEYLQANFDERRQKLSRELNHIQIDFEESRAELENEIEYLQAARDEFVARPLPTPAPKKFYRPARAIKGAASVDDVDDFVDAFKDILDINGAPVEQLAKYLRAACDDKIPLLLAGSRAHEIADAFSIALIGRTAALLDCAAVNSLDDLNVCSTANDKIIALINPFAPNFIAYLPEVLNLDGKFIIALHPFAEDLRLEPRSLRNYLLPIFTDPILNSQKAADKRIKKLLSAFDDDIRDQLRTMLGDDE